MCEILSYNTMFILNLLNLHNFLFCFYLSINYYYWQCKNYNYRTRLINYGGHLTDRVTELY